MTVFDDLKQLSLPKFARFLLNVLEVDGYFDNEFCSNYCKYSYRDHVYVPGGNKVIIRCRLKECKYGKDTMLETIERYLSAEVK